MLGLKATRSFFQRFFGVISVHIRTCIRRLTFLSQCWIVRNALTPWKSELSKEMQSWLGKTKLRSPAKGLIFSDTLNNPPNLPPRSLTARPWKMVAGRRCGFLLGFGKTFQGEGRGLFGFSGDDHLTKDSPSWKVWTVSQKPIGCIHGNPSYPRQSYPLEIRGK